MHIRHFERPFEDVKDLFVISTKNTEYCIGTVYDEGYVSHLYYGKKLNDHDFSGLIRINEYPYGRAGKEREKCSFHDCLSFEYPSHGIGDFREDCLSVETAGGNSACLPLFDSFEIIEGKPKITGLPATFGKKDEVTTLILHCSDKVLKLNVDLIYSSFYDNDVITRSVKISNNADGYIYLKKVYSACLDMDNKDFEALSLHGSWARERHIERTKVTHNKTIIESVRGESSHQDSPFLALTTPDTTQETGEVYAMNFVYSGNFRTGAFLDQFDHIRMFMGIGPEDFKWKLVPGESFETPEVVMTYSDKGLGKMTRSFHDLYREHLIRSPYLHKKRPILINNWEATYFEFDTEKLIAIARQASELGIEMLVMDDGWFGKRDNDSCSLGDWTVNENKLKGGLKYLVDEINKLGMKFGIWFEPEMISPDSDLYRAHPDWAIHIKGREGVRSRNQFVLDLSRKDVCDHIYEQVASILRSANIEYVKWDMNRQLTDIGSAELPADRMGELFHRYVLGVYSLQERLMTEFPNLLLENCSGGGGRFDPGMLYYSPQIWCSDDTDAIERLSIQEGTALVYPLSTMGAHVSDCPNHAVGRTTPFMTRGHVALAGTFGYELDVTRIPKEDVSMIPAQVEEYHRYNDLVREGDYYRLASYSANHTYDLYGVVSKDKREALFTFVQVLGSVNRKSRRIYFRGLDPELRYRIDENERTYTGDMLMNAGYLIPEIHGDFVSILIHMEVYDG
ncbi:MAG: alpha-galactosidase [Lachnospiraceae bacterium]|nr:alpha-galactosidase [Lachnospiraceae bacterium]